jgi:hypothetical protein
MDDNGQAQQLEEEIKDRSVDADPDVELDEPESEEEGPPEWLLRLLENPGLHKLASDLLATARRNGRESAMVRRRFYTLQAKLHVHTRRCFLIGLAVCLAFLTAVILLLRDTPDTLLPVLTAVIGLLAGAGGGFLFSTSQSTESPK